MGRWGCFQNNPSVFVSHRHAAHTLSRRQSPTFWGSVTSTHAFSVSRFLSPGCSHGNTLYTTVPFLVNFATKLYAICPDKIAELPQNNMAGNNIANIANEKAFVNRTKGKFICRNKKRSSLRLSLTNHKNHRALRTNLQCTALYMQSARPPREFNKSLKERLRPGQHLHHIGVVTTQFVWRAV